MLNVYTKELGKKKLLFSTLKDSDRLKQLIKKNYPESKIFINQTQILIYEKEQKPNKKNDLFKKGGTTTNENSNGTNVITH